MAPHPLVCSAGGLPKRRRVVDVVRNVALLPGPVHIGDSGWVGVPPSAVTAEARTHAFRFARFFLISG